MLFILILSCRVKGSSSTIYQQIIKSSIKKDFKQDSLYTAKMKLLKSQIDWLPVLQLQGMMEIVI